MPVTLPTTMHFLTLNTGSITSDKAIILAALRRTSTDFRLSWWFQGGNSYRCNESHQQSREGGPLCSIRASDLLVSDHLCCMLQSLHLLQFVWPKFCFLCVRGGEVAPRMGGGCGTMAKITLGPGANAAYGLPSSLKRLNPVLKIGDLQAGSRGTHMHMAAGNERSLDLHPFNLQPPCHALVCIER